jgi:hypothetical protein
MNTAAALFPRIFFNQRRVARLASTPSEPIAPASRGRRSADAHRDDVLTRQIAAGTLHTRWA